MPISAPEIRSPAGFQLRLLGNSLLDGALYYLGGMPEVREAVAYGKKADLRNEGEFKDFDARLERALTDERRIHAFLMAWMKYRSDAKPEDEFLPAKEALVRRADDCEGFARIADRYMAMIGWLRPAVVDMYWIPQLENPESGEEGWGHETKPFMRNGSWCTLDNWGLASHGTDRLIHVVRNFDGRVNYYEVYEGVWNSATSEFEYKEPLETHEISGDRRRQRSEPFNIDWSNMRWL